MVSQCEHTWRLEPFDIDSKTYECVHCGERGVECRGCYDGIDVDEDGAPKGPCENCYGKGVVPSFVYPDQFAD